MDKADIRHRLQQDYGLDTLQLELLFSYVDMVMRAPLNLTGWNEAAVWQRGIYQTLDLRQYLLSRSPGAALDVGSGGGFPGMVLALALPRWQWTLLEARTRRAEFLERVKESLHLGNVRVVARRAEEWIRQNPELREGFDLVTMRAVAPLASSLELGMPYVRVTGRLCIVQGPNGAAELARCQALLQALNGNLREWLFRGQDGQTAVFAKRGATPPRFPRAAKSLGRG
jgi:16S rRNA (guanine527-N7)-methyltransferase